MQISYNQACGKGCSTLEQDLELCEKAGFDYIEIRLDMLVSYLKKHPVEKLAAFFEKSRIKPHAFNALYLYPEFLSERDDLQRQETLLEEFWLGCRVGKIIGSRYFVVVPPLQRNPNEGPFKGKWQDTFQNCVRILTKLSEMATPYDMNLCFELVGFNRSSVRSVIEANAIVSAVNKPNVGFVFDSYNIYLNNGFQDFSLLELVDPKKIFAIHLMNGDDVPEEERGQDKRRFCDAGVLDLNAFLIILKKIGYKGMVSVETFRPEYWDESPQWVVQEAYRTTRRCMEKAGVF